jgi:alginate O-acetyltransferase complex protein AlgI
MDFSGYTDIAIGIALLMGFRFNTNFNSPYKAQNTAEFWKRWHISLSTWLKDYLYIPLGGNKKGTLGSYLLGSFLLLVFLAITRFSWIAWIVVALCLLMVWIGLRNETVKKHVDTNINLMITMLLGGFWHGSTWNFIVWGGLNGIGLIVYKYWKRVSPYEKLNTLWVRIWKVALTFSFISFTRIWFRSADKETADAVLYKLGYDLDWSLATKVLMAYPMVFLIFLGGMLVHWLPIHWKRSYRLWFIKSHPVVKILSICGVVLMIWQTITAESVPFIYFQF